MSVRAICSSRISARYAAGLRVGGPLVRDASTWFASYEHQQFDEVTPYTGIARNGIEGGWARAPRRDDNFFFRTDFNLGSKNFLMTQLLVDDSHATELNVGGTTTPEAGFSLDQGLAQITTSLTSVLSPRLLNEARLLVGRSTFDQQANTDRPGVQRPSGSFGGNNLNSQNRGAERLQLVDDISLQAGIMR